MSPQRTMSQVRYAVIIITIMLDFNRDYYLLNSYG